MHASDRPHRIQPTPRPSPWAFFFPVFVAVVLGILAADLVRLLVVTAAARQAQREVVVELERMVDAMPPGPAPPVQTPLPGYPAPNAAAPVGSLACSQGAILRRIENGWEQVGRTGRRAACRTSSR